MKLIGNIISNAVNITPTFSVNSEIIKVNVPSGNGSFKIIINGEEFIVNVGGVSPIISKPTVLVPVNLSNSVTPNFLIETIPLSTSNGVLTTHLFTDWQISLSSDFTQVVRESINDQTNLTSWLVNSLTNSSTYYLRLRYGNDLGDVSPWSDVVTFSIMPLSSGHYVPTLETQSISSRFNGNGVKFGLSLALSRDGGVLAVGQRYFDKNSPEFMFPGRVLVYNRDDDGTYQYVKTINRNEGPSPADEFGRSIAINDTKDILAICSIDDSLDAYGSLYIHKYTESNGWVFHAKLTSPTSHINEVFGATVAMSGSGDRIFVSTMNTDFGGLILPAIHVFKSEDLITWTFETTLYEPTFVPDSNFGSSLSVTPDGKVLVVGSHTTFNTTLSGVGGEATGAVTIFTYDQATLGWDSGFQFNSSYIDGTPATEEPSASKDFGASVKISDDGTVIVVGAETANETTDLNNPGKLNVGAIYIYSRINGNLVRIGRYTASDCQMDSSFGCSVDITSDNEVIVVGSPYFASTDTSGSSTPDSGRAYVFVKNGTTYVQSNILELTNKYSNDCTGFITVISKNGDTIILSSPTRSTEVYSKAGVVSILK